MHKKKSFFVKVFVKVGAKCQYRQTKPLAASSLQLPALSLPQSHLEEGVVDMSGATFV